MGRPQVPDGSYAHSRMRRHQGAALSRSQKSRAVPRQQKMWTSSIASSAGSTSLCRSSRHARVSLLGGQRGVCEAIVWGCFGGEHVVYRLWLFPVSENSPLKDPRKGPKLSKGGRSKAAKIANRTRAQDRCTRL